MELFLDILGRVFQVGMTVGVVILCKYSFTYDKKRDEKRKQRIEQRRARNDIN